MKRFKHAGIFYKGALLSVALIVAGCGGNNSEDLLSGASDETQFLRSIGIGDDLDTSAWKLAFQDEFDSDSLDTDVWTYQTGRGDMVVGDAPAPGDGWGNGELQYYTEESVTLAEGKLIITAADEGAPDSDVDRPYTSGRIISQDKLTMQFGRVDIRAKLPKGQGFWPALWMLGNSLGDLEWPFVGEIDIMEAKGETDTTYGNFYFADSNGNVDFRVGEFTSEDVDFTDSFNVFSIVWDSQQIQWYVNGEQFMARDISLDDRTEFQEEFFFLMNVAVGGSFPGAPDDTSVFPQTMMVDYIRIYEAL
jgi:beta-glucanase (GH16 family)